MRIHPVHNPTALYRVVCYLFYAVSLLLLAIPAEASTSGPNGVNVGFDFNWSSVHPPEPLGYTASYIAVTSSSGSTLNNCSGAVTSSTAACDFAISYAIGGVAQPSVVPGGVYSTWPAVIGDTRACDITPANSSPLTMFNCFNSGSFGQIFMAGATGALSDLTMPMTCLNPTGKPVTGFVAILYQVNSGGSSIPGMPLAAIPVNLKTCPTLTSWNSHTFSASDFAQIPLNFPGITLTAGNFYGVYFTFDPLMTLKVTTLSDQTNAGALCNGTDTCSLRDAVRLANNLGFTNISLTSAPSGTIRLDSGLSITASVNLQGPGANALTITNSGSASGSSLITIGNDATVNISGLTITNGSSTNGGAIINNGEGALTITESVLSGNSATNAGGAIYNNAGGALSIARSTISGNSALTGGGVYHGSGELVITNSTFTGNTASQFGGAIDTASSSAINNSTISGNTSASGGGIYLQASLLLANSIVSGNMSQSAENDLDGLAPVDRGGNILGYVNSAPVNANPIKLSSLDTHGGPTPTMVPLPGSPAICAGLVAQIPVSVTTDQRGTGYLRSNSNYPGYNSPACVDAGAVQTAYTLSFSTQPRNVYTSVAMISPQVTLMEQNVTASYVNTGTVSVADANNSLGSSATTSDLLASGISVFGNLLFNTAASSDTLTATLPLTATLQLSAQSTAFDVLPRYPTTVVTSNAAATYSDASQVLALAAMVTSSNAVNTGSVLFTVVDSGGAPVGAPISGTVNNGVASVNYLLPAATHAGSYSITVAYSSNDIYLPSSDATHVLTISQATPTVSAWPTASALTHGQTLSASTLSGGSASVTGTFAWTTPSTLPAIGTTAQGVTFTPANTSNYSTVAGTANVIVAKAISSVALSSSLGQILLGSAVSFTAKVPSTATGAVDFYDGTTKLASVTLSQGTATYSTSSLAVGMHSMTASYAGDSNFQSSVSAVVSQSVTDYTLTGGSTDPGSSTPVPTQTIGPGGAATYSVQAVPAIGTTLPADLTLSVTHNLPAGSAVTFTAAGITTSASTLVLPGGQAMPAVQLKVQLPTTTAALHPSNPLKALPLVFGLLLPFSRKLRRAGARSFSFLLVLLLAAASMCVGLTGCGALNTGYSAQRNYTITITATSGTLSHSMDFNLTVQ